MFAEAEHTEISIRKAFVARPGCALLSADYSQIEMRLMAHLAQDEALLGALHSGGDLFTQMAAQCQGVAVSDVSAEQRANAKAIAYGILYGIGAAGLARQMDRTFKEAQQYLESWLARFPQVRSFIQHVQETCQMQGFVSTLSGRRRYLPAINSNDKAARQGAQRQAVNTVCQGSAADLIKLAMIRIDKQLHEAVLEGKEARMLLQIHDELLFEVSEADIDWLQGVVRESMENAMQLCVPLRVQFKKGESWGSMVSL